jgi:phage shock protein C
MHDGRMTDQPLEPDEQRPRPEPEQPAPEPPPRPEAPPASPLLESERRLLRTRADRVIAGVCGGLGRYLGVDPVIIRIAAVLLVFAGGAGIVLYLIGWIAIPEESWDGVAPAGADSVEPTSGGVALGLIFVGLGAVFLADQLWPDFLSWRYVWPIALIVVGGVILLRSRR